VQLQGVQETMDITFKGRDLRVFRTNILKYQPKEERNLETILRTITYLLTYLLIYLLTYLLTYSMEQSPS